MFRLAHVTDPHFRGFDGARPGEFFGKRAIGLANLVVSRVRKHKMQLLDDLRVDLRAQAPDHLALTGDLSNVALAGEWRAALAWIDLSGVPPESVSVIPGNHDAYVEAVVKERTFERLFAAYQTTDLAQGDDAIYPFVHLREEVALIGVSSSVATGDLGAWGRVGTPQLERLEAILRSPALTGKTRVVLIHHARVAQGRRAAEPARSRGLRGRAGARGRRVGAAWARPRRSARPAARPGWPADPGDRRRLGVVRRRPGAPLALQHL
jgi:3',5'-cyclic AMP phosphodiesterase CpdA